jgi:ferric-dicitrate binding protein FerR (iron transport regulator)
MSRLALLLEQRRDGRLDAGQRAELERLLDDPTQASLAVAVERSALQISAGLRSRPGLGPAVRAGSQRRSRGLRALRGVRRSLERRSWAWAWAAAAVLAIAVLVVLVGRTPSAADSAMRLEQGTVTVQRGGERLPIPVGADWGGDELQVASPSRFVAGDGTVVALESGSRVRLTPSDGLLLELDHGAAELVVQPQPPGRQVAVRTRDAEISVIGTRFRVTTRDDGTGVSVAEGRVRIRSGGADRFLAAGQTWDSRPGSPGMQAELRGFIADGDGWIADGRPRVSFADGTSLEAVERIDADGSLRLVGGGWDVSVGWMSGGGRASGRIILPTD